MKLLSLVLAGVQITARNTRPSPAVQKSRQRIPPGLSKLIFGELLERPLCSLFASSNTPGFSGHCDGLLTQCSNEKHWCRNGNPGPALVQQLIAAQVAKVSAPVTTVRTVLSVSSWF